MNQYQIIAFRIIMQFIIIMCGQLLGFTSQENGKKDYWRAVQELKRFYNKVDPEHENE